MVSFACGKEAECPANLLIVEPFPSISVELFRFQLGLHCNTEEFFERRFVGYFYRIRDARPLRQRNFFFGIKVLDNRPKLLFVFLFLFDKALQSLPGLLGQVPVQEIPVDLCCLYF